MRVARAVVLDKQEKGMLEQNSAGTFSARASGRAGADCCGGRQRDAGSANRLGVGYHTREGCALAQPLSGWRDRRPPKRCVTSRQTTHHQRSPHNRSDSQNYTGKALQRHPLEHAHDGRRYRTERNHRTSDLACQWPEAASGEDFQSQRHNKGTLALGVHFTVPNDLPPQ